MKLNFPIWRMATLSKCAAWLLAAGFTGSLALAGLADWPVTDGTCRPWAYNWWPGSAVDKENLSREFKRYAEAGLGGIQIIPVYGARGAESRYIPYLSPQWMDMLAFAVREGRRLGLGVDMTTGTGWCFGGPWITPDLGCRKVVVQRFAFPEDRKLPAAFDPKRVTLQCVVARGPDGRRVEITDKVKAGGKLEWMPPAPGWEVVALGHAASGQKVKRAAPGGEGPMLDPFDANAMRKHLEVFSAAFDKPGSVKPRSMYHDSYEYAGATWSPTLFAEFAKRRGYRLQDELEAFEGHIPDADRVARVRCDYRETLSDLLVEDVFSQWGAWCRKRGILTRNQAHGSPVNWLDFYNVADIPETEMFGHGGPDPLVSRFDEHIGGADRDPLVSKFASSAAHTAGKPLVSSETGTWMAEHFCESFEEMKCLVDLLFLSGINHVFYHGCVYSPDDAAWPGWLFYAATQMNPRNPLWHEAPTLNRYIERSQSILRAGHSDNDVLLYWPIHETWSHGKEFQFTVHERDWLHGQPVGAAARALWAKGYGFDYVSDRLLAPMEVADGRIKGKDGTRWRVVVVPECHQMPTGTLETLLRLAGQGAVVVFENRLPDDVPGLGNLAVRRQALRQALGGIPPEAVEDGVSEAKTGAGRVLVGPLEAALKAAGVERESLVDLPGVKFIRRVNGQETYYLIVNHGMTPVDGWVPLASKAESAVAMDALSGGTGSVDLRHGADGKTEVALRIEPGHSLILHVFASGKVDIPPLLVARPGDANMTIEGPWQVRFLSGGPVLPKPFETAALKSWTENGDPAAQAFSGTALYHTTFNMPAISGGPRLLDLGEARNVARVRLNGISLGSLIMHPYRTIVPPGVLKQTGNSLEIEVTNLGANRLRDLDRRKVKWRIFHDINFASISYKPFDASNWPVFDSGLLGPVRIVDIRDRPAQPNP